jgi:hypothetical protein
MTIVRTYFLNRIDPLELSRLLVGGKTFVLENVDDVDATAAAMAVELARHGFNPRDVERRFSFGSDVALALPWFLSLPFAGWMLTRALIAWLRNPRANVLLFKRKGAIEVRYKRRGPVLEAA